MIQIFNPNRAVSGVFIPLVFHFHQGYCQSVRLFSKLLGIGLVVILVSVVI